MTYCSTHGTSLLAHGRSKMWPDKERSTDLALPNKERMIVQQLRKQQLSCVVEGHASLSDSLFISCGDTHNRPASIILRAVSQHK